MVVVPEIDIGPLFDGGPQATAAASAIDDACRHVGFFYIAGHGVDQELLWRLDALARQFFARPEPEKREIAMARGGLSWRGWFPLGGELTAGVADDKEGLYFGADLGPEHPRVGAGTPMHGPNLYPRHPADLKPVVREYMEAMTAVAQTVLVGIALGLGLAPSWFRHHLTADPLVLFRIFRYPGRSATAGRWGVGEHTDYGLLTILAQDESGGLEVRTRRGWVEAPPRPGTMLCNLGDMLERVTGGRYRSTAHRVRVESDGDRLSFPFFLDPSWDATVDRLPIVDRPADDDGARRWDHVSVHGFDGSYGDYILSKVSRVFPDLVTGTPAGAGPGEITGGPS